jgi:hypothetical protein
MKKIVMIRFASHIFNTFTRSKASEAQERTSEWSNLIFFQNCPFWARNKNKFSTFTFWCMVIILGPHLVYT